MGNGLPCSLFNGLHDTRGSVKMAFHLTLPLRFILYEFYFLLTSSFFQIQKIGV